MASSRYSVSSPRTLLCVASSPRRLSSCPGHYTHDESQARGCCSISRPSRCRRSNVISHVDPSANELSHDFSGKAQEAVSAVCLVRDSPVCAGNCTRTLPLPLELQQELDGCLTGALGGGSDKTMFPCQPPRRASVNMAVERGHSRLVLWPWSRHHLGSLTRPIRDRVLRPMSMRRDVFPTRSPHQTKGSLS